MPRAGSSGNKVYERAIRAGANMDRGDATRRGKQINKRTAKKHARVDAAERSGRITTRQAVRKSQKIQRRANTAVLRQGIKAKTKGRVTGKALTRRARRQQKAMYQYPQRGDT